MSVFGWDIGGGETDGGGGGSSSPNVDTVNQAAWGEIDRIVGFPVFAAMSSMKASTAAWESAQNFADRDAIRRKQEAAREAAETRKAAGPPPPPGNLSKGTDPPSDATKGLKTPVVTGEIIGIVSLDGVPYDELPSASPALADERLADFDRDMTWTENRGPRETSELPVTGTFPEETPKSKLDAGGPPKEAASQDGGPRVWRPPPPPDGYDPYGAAADRFESYNFAGGESWSDQGVEGGPMQAMPAPYYQVPAQEPSVPSGAEPGQGWSHRAWESVQGVGRGALKRKVGDEVQAMADEWERSAGLEELLGLGSTFWRRHHEMIERSLELPVPEGEAEELGYEAEPWVEGVLLFLLGMASPRLGRGKNPRGVADEIHPEEGEREPPRPTERRARPIRGAEAAQEQAEGVGEAKAQGQRGQGPRIQSKEKSDQRQENELGKIKTSADAATEFGEESSDEHQP